MILSRPNLLVIGDETDILLERNGNARLISHSTPFPKISEEIFILADNFAQEFKREKLPRLGFFDRRKYALQKLKSVFPRDGSPCFSSATVINANEALYIRIHCELPSVASKFVTGMYSLPLECAGMARKLLPEAAKGWCAAVSLHRTGGMRQTITLDGRIFYSRMKKIPPKADEAIAEMETIANYLSRFGLKGLSDMRLIAIMPEQFNREAEKTSGRFLSMKCMTPHDAAARLRLKPAVRMDEEYSDFLFAAWFLKKFRAESFMDIGAGGGSKRFLKPLSLSLWALFATFFVWQSAALLADGARVVGMKKSALSLTEEIDEKRGRLSGIDEPLDEIRAALERKRIFGAERPSPWKDLDVLAASVSGRAVANKIDWKEENGGILTVEMRIFGEDDEDGLQEKIKAALSRRYEAVFGKTESGNMKIMVDKGG